MIKLVDKSKDSVTFELKGVSPAFANALRRAIAEDVPTLAIHNIEIFKNNSVLYDEVVGHRLGLIPLTTDIKGYEPLPADAPEGEFVAKSMVQLSLKAKGPALVVAGDMKTKDPKVKPAYPDMPIVSLLKGQELEFEAWAVMNTGRHHVKWVPSLAWHNYKPKVTVNNNHKELAAFIGKYPPQVVKENKIDKALIEKNNLYDAVDGVNDEIVKVEYDPQVILFSIEPFGQLDPHEIVQSAGEALADGFTRLAKQLEGQ